MIKISLPGKRDERFIDAIAVLDECKVDNLPCCGFNNTFMCPGGYYRNSWWERDTSLALSGYKWVNQEFCEKVLCDFVNVQKENGRIPLWGNDKVEDYDDELSAIPVLFEVAYKICRRTTDKEFIDKIYTMLSRYLNWWLSDIKRDSGTGLVCGIFEETDPSDFRIQKQAAQVDLNVQVAVGADVLSKLAEYLEKKEDAHKYRLMFESIRNSINNYMWDDSNGMYYTRFIESGDLYFDRVQNSMFDTFKRKICPDDRRQRLLSTLLDDSLFAWEGPFGITSLSKKCPHYEETVGTYQGSHSWSGNIWSLRNEIIATGLLECGYSEEAAHLSLMTMDVFGGVFPEFASPTDGRGHGVHRYGWSASHYIELAIEIIFGIDYCAWDDSLTVKPNIPKEFFGEKISIENVVLGNGYYVNVYIDCSENPVVKYEISDTEI